MGGLDDAAIEMLRARGQRSGWTFRVGANGVTSHDLASITGLREPSDWRRNATFDDMPIQRGDVPTAFDWRDLDGFNACPPIRSQGTTCGSCWAFGVTASLECNLMYRDGHAPDLSEQWLVSCCGLGGCDGEWPGNAADFMQSNGIELDTCGDAGSVLESDLPYEGEDVLCNCPYQQRYTIEGWAFIGPQWGVPSVPQLKQAILNHGPVSVCVAVNDAFHAYVGGIFNDCDSSDINHVVVLVGWDDAQGSEGVWVIRNSWGQDWGEAGYMRIEYGCSNIGYGGLYLDLPSLGDVDGDELVGPEDLQDVLGAWGCTTCRQQDVNGNGLIEVRDLITLLRAWGPCP